jgi:N6-adenosine-specific RNA methylase IME4
MKSLTIDSEFQSIIPALTTLEYQELERSLLVEGCRDSLVIWGDILIDGHNRYKLCCLHGIEFETQNVDFDTRGEAKIWIIQNQFGRRNLNKYQRAKLALVLKPLIVARAKAKQAEGGKHKVIQKSGEPIRTDKELAKAAGVSHDTISKTEKIEAKATVEQKKQLETGVASINQVHKQIRAKEKREERVQQLAEAGQPTDLDTLGTFSVIYADPPWRYEHSKTETRAIENQYPTMTLEDICDLEVADITTNDCVLFLWSPSPKLAEAMKVIRSWGFNYRTCAIWSKDRIGAGYYFRQRHELLLVATKGKMPVPEPANRPDSVIESPREEHSKKPDVVYGLIERMYPELRKVELFARNRRDNWVSWGNEIESA